MVVLGDVPRFGIDGGAGLTEDVDPGILLLQVGHLVVAQPGRLFFEPSIDAFLLDVLGDESAFVDEGHDGAVLDRVFDGIGRADDAAESADGRLLLG